ncbi:hypothetical protein [Paraliomyxa miuraensis]|uniref:hypothetical protein n=1 Tax=Paraliomyxa miuraensis TaxID=376150 RepID=UPI00224D8731|nr:hypothetical protein [Paraliomyxa miuraensis]MCX4246949.1 hypothetical protein [Paraliomyxa miuraensis]
MRIVTTSIVSAVLALGPSHLVAAAEPAYALAPISAPATRHASVDIDTSDIGEEGPVVKRRIRERTDVVLRAASVVPARPEADDPMIHVDVDALQGNEPGYRFELWVSRGGEPVGERQAIECPLCTESEVVERVEATVASVLEQLDSYEVVASPEPESDPQPKPESDPDPDPPASSDPPANDPPRAKLSGLGKGGVAMLVVGAAGLGTGAVLVALPPKVEPEDPLYETTTHPPGFVALGVGAAAVISGVVMLVVDRKRARRSARTSTATLVPSLRPGGAGLVLRGAF